MAEQSEPLIPAEPPPAYDDDATTAVTGASTAAGDEKKKSSNTKPAGPPLPRPPFPLDLPVLNEVRGKRIILASASPRRRHIIAQLGLGAIEIFPSTLPEDLPKENSPFEYALRTAERKALHVYQAALNDRVKGDPALLIAADTVIVAPSGDVYEKPRNALQHESMLRTLRDAPNHRHSVVTAVAVLAPLASARDPGYRLLTAIEETVVLFDKDVSDDLLKAYVRTREGADKAGGYGIQGLGSLLVERIEGAYDNVVGLPLRTTLRLIERCLDQSDEVEEEYEAAMEANVL